MKTVRSTTALLPLMLLSWLWTAIPSPAAADTLPEPDALAPTVTSRPSVPDLGTPPEAPADLQLLHGESLAEASVAPGLTVSTASREQSRNFFLALYTASENTPSGWNGNLAACTAGTTAPSFKDAVQLRINYFRAMAGVPAAITFSQDFSAKNQQAALMMSANSLVSHDPSSTWSCYTAGGDEAAGNSNLALGYSGWEAVTEYLLENGSSNADAGHRRWLLYPQTLTMGSGDIPPTPGHAAANALWILDSAYWNTRPATRDDFVAWPPPGYVPYQVVSPRWSLSYPGADFSGATVTMRKNGSAVPVRLETVYVGYGENTLVWVPDNLDPSVLDSIPRPSADTVYAVTVGNVRIGGTPRSFAYSVTIFDPQTPGADHVSADVTGPAAPEVGLASRYTITPVPGADSYQWRYAGTVPASGYNAETGLSGMTATISPSPGYTGVSTDVHASGGASYHLAQPDEADQVLTLERSILPGPSGQMILQSRLGWATPDQVAVVEASPNDGATWQELYRQAGSNSSGELSFTRRTLDLSPFAGTTIRIRLSYRLKPGNVRYYPSTGTGVGWYLDDISFADTAELAGATVSPLLASPSFDFTPPAGGSSILQARALLYGRYPLEWGQLLRVTARAATFPLTCIISGTGAGSVSSSPGGISCPYGDCATTFPSGSPVILMAAPGADSRFGGWSGGGCGGTGTCSVPMTGAATVTARFDHVPPVLVPLATPPEYPSLALAYGAVPDGQSMLARAVSFPENLSLTMNKQVTLEGGYDTGFTGTVGASVLDGCLTISRGSLVVSGLVIR